MERVGGPQILLEYNTIALEVPRLDIPSVLSVTVLCTIACVAPMPSQCQQCITRS